MAEDTRLATPLVPSHHPGATNSESISTFLGYMQRRLSDFVVSDSSRRELHGDDSENQNSRGRTTDGGSAVADSFASQDLNNNPDPSNYYLTNHLRCTGLDDGMAFSNLFLRSSNPNRITRPTFFCPCLQPRIPFNSIPLILYALRLCSYRICRSQPR
ncbi:hypothetical protein BDZ97DRAFT_717196 [Flammula alnicola]|nr:hypothetical protein BDZ97DRAFT_717196 [Flammula alnicola]